MENIIIRKFIEQDAKDLKDIYLKIRKEEFTWVNNKDIHIDDFYSSTEGESIIVAVINNNVVGFASIWEPDKFIHNLFIKKEYRRFGIGKKLINEAVNIWGTPLTLKCVKENENAIKFYIDNGWQCIKEELGPEGPYYLMRRI